MNGYRFGGHLTMLDRPTAVTVSVRTFGEYQCECDETTALTVSAAILQALTQIGEASPSAAKLCGNPAAVPTIIQPGLDDLLPKRGLPRVQLRDFNWSLSPDSIDALKAAAAAKKSAQATPPAIAVGAAVLVQWSDGNRYPGNVRAIGDGQFEIAFADGQARWIPAAFVALA